MNNSGSDDELTDSQVEALLTNQASTPAGYEGVSEVLDGLRTASTVDPVPVSAALAEFVTATTDTPTTSGPARDGGDELTPEPLDMSQPAAAPRPGSPPRRKHRMASVLANSAGAKFALAGVVAVAAVTGAHAADIIDVPGLPDQATTEVLLADAGAAAAEQSGQPATAGAISEADPQGKQGGTTEQGATNRQGATNQLEITRDGEAITLQLGDVSLSITIDASDDGMGVSIDIEGVSPACEAAIESLGPELDGLDLFGQNAQVPDSLDALGAEIESACADDLEALGDLDDLSFDLGGLGLEGLFGEGDLESFLEQFGDTFGEDGFPSGIPEGLFGEDFDPSDLEEFFKDFNGGEFFDPKNLDKFFSDLEDSDLFDPEMLDEFFGDSGGLDSTTEPEELDA